MFVRIGDGFVAQTATVESLRVQADPVYEKNESGQVFEHTMYRIYLTPPNQAIYESGDANTTFGKLEEILSVITDASENGEAVCDLRAVLAFAPTNAAETSNEAAE